MKGRTSMTVRHMYIFKTVCECQRDVYKRQRKYTP